MVIGHDKAIHWYSGFVREALILKINEALTRSQLDIQIRTESVLICR